jgi:hypothetical protein
VRYFLVALLVTGAWISVDATRQGAAVASDDRQVFAAILEHSIRPEVVRFSTIAKIPGPPPLLVLDQTSSMCQGARDRARQICVRVEDIENVRTPNRLGTLIGGSAYGSVLRSELVEAFISRNAQSERFPTLEGAGVVLVPFASLQETLKQRQRETVGYSAFSLPAYSDDGHAVVFGFYTCGGRCDRGRLLILARTSGKWQVEVASTLWIS